MKTDKLWELTWQFGYRIILNEYNLKLLVKIMDNTQIKS